MSVHDNEDGSRDDLQSAETNSDCLFCRIARGELNTEFVAESEFAVAFRDIDPQAPTHVLVIPREHVSALRHVEPRHAAMVSNLLMMAQRVATNEGLEAGGYRVLINDGPDAGQTVFHLHVHVLGGKTLSTALG